MCLLRKITYGDFLSSYKKKKVHILNICLKMPPLSETVTTKVEVILKNWSNHIFAFFGELFEFWRLRLIGWPR